MTAEIVGVLKREIKPKTFRWVTILAAVGTASWKVYPVVVAILATPSRLDAIETQGKRWETYIVADSSWKARNMCIQEVMAGIRPRLDLTTRCAE